MHSPKVTERVYVAADAADAFVRAMLAAHNVPGGAEVTITLPLAALMPQEDADDGR